MSEIRVDSITDNAGTGSPDFPNGISLSGFKLLSGANVRASEGAGTTTLTSADSYWQVFNLSADRTVVLPTTDIVKGQPIRLENRSVFELTIQSSDLSQITVLRRGYVEVSALQDAPTTPAHWQISKKGELSSVLSVSSADYTVLDDDGYETILVSTGAANRTITLPTVADNAGRRIRVKKTDSGAGTVIIEGEGSETIDGDLNATLSGLNSFLIIQANETGTAWFIVSNRTKYQIKVPAGDITTATTIAAMGYSGLTVGRAYRITLTSTVLYTNTGTDQVTLKVQDGGTIVDFLDFYHEADLGADNFQVTMSFSKIYVMTNGTSLSVVSGGVPTANRKFIGAQTFIQVEELPNHQVNTTW